MSVKLDQAFIKTIVDANLLFEIEGELIKPDVVIEGVDYEPSDKVYLELINVPNDTTAYSMSHSDETDGVFIVNVNVPTGYYPIVVKLIADYVAGLFKIGSNVEYEEQKAYITKVRRNPSFAGQSFQGYKVTGSQAGWYRQVVTITYRAFIRRNSK